MTHLTSFLALAAVLLAVGAAICAMIVVLLARALTMPPRMTDGKAAWVLKRLSPGDLGLPFEETSFDIRDARSGEPLRIAGWWIPHPQSQGRCVILIHGYADAKVGAIAWAPTWHALGYNVLAIDLRAHGESGGRQCTGGYFERHDVADVIDRLRAERPEQTRRLVLFGVSFGATVAVATAALRDDVDAVVLDSPVPDFDAGARLQMEMLGAPRGVVHKWAVRLSERMTGATLNDVRMLGLLPRLTCPVFVIAPEDDALLEHGMLDALREALPERPSNVFWLVHGAEHLMPLSVDAAEYRRRLDAFLQVFVSPAAAVT